MTEIEAIAPTVAAIMEQSGVAFGTSGARGLVSAMTDRVCYAYTQGFLSYLTEIGEFTAGDSVALAGDLRPSTPRILAACAAAIVDAGGVPVFCGFVPTPAMALYALDQRIASLMVTGSHIPADRNGIKFYRPIGEVLKSDEGGMKRQSVNFPAGRFDHDGMLSLPSDLPEPVDVLEAYVARYREFFGEDALKGRRIGVYQHSAVGRDMLVRIFEELGARVTPLGRAETFVPVDTEAVRPEDKVLAAQWSEAQGFDAIASTDGDSDRPLLADENGIWLRGDVLGILCALQLKAETVVTPVSSNTALERSGQFVRCERTKIGSPYVIAEMQNAGNVGAGMVCGYEANGGFLLQTAVRAGRKVLTALPTRDAVLPIVAALVAAKGAPLSELVGTLPLRVTYSDRIENVPPSRSQALFSRLLDGVSDLERLSAIDGVFSDFAGCATEIDLTDGLRISFASGGIIHLRASGNAPELRCYTEADTEKEAIRLNGLTLEVLHTLLG
ncbi:phosphomannomutase [Novosphingobium sp. 9]|uniref:phosphomannomutase n=1 Tax=Novosphingobium sp. 9 TaxID=2025349 RepID=UPI0021B63437|nr:phosphomannomutase [Novosphingobium sp. 9]